MHTRLAVDRLIASKHFEDAGECGPDCGLDCGLSGAE
jgi:hypothetical protein